MADTPSDAGASSDNATRTPPQSPHQSPRRSPHRSKSPQRSPQQSPPQSPRGGGGDNLDLEILKGAAWAPPWTKHELHSREVYARSKTPSPPCGKYKRDATCDEINKEVVKKREAESQKSLLEAKKRHKHEGLVMQRAREFERKCRMECEKYAKQMTEYKGRMQKREAESKPPYKNRAEQIIALGLNKGPPSRPGSPPK
ncbi:unnamed protein product [Calypogeia fissa]